MKTKSALESAFFNPRASLGFGFGAVGLLLGVIAFIALPTPSAFAPPPPCTDVVFTNSNGSGGSKLVTMESHSEGYPGSPCTIYFTSSSGYPPAPTHSSTVYLYPQVVGWGTERTFRAFGHKTSAIPEDSNETEHTVVNGGP